MSGAKVERGSPPEADVSGGSWGTRGSQDVVVVMDRLIGAASLFQDLVTQHPQAQGFGKLASFRYLAQAIFEDAIALQVLHNRKLTNSANPGQ